MSKRRNYSPEFKHETVELTRMEGVTISLIARLRRELAQVKKERDF